MKRFKGIRTDSISRQRTIPFCPTSIPAPERVVLPLGGGPLGAPVPVVEPGAEVVAGQCLAKSDSPLVPPVYASLTGVVSDIKPWGDHLGNEALSIVIEARPAQAEQSPGGISPQPDDAARIFLAMAAAGIEEIDPYTWPLALRIAKPELTSELAPPDSTTLSKPIEILIINAMDRQPDVVLRRMVLGDQEQELAEAAAVLKEVSGAQRIILVGSEDHRLSDEFRQVLKGMGVEKYPCPNRYPLAFEPLLVREVTGREVPFPAGDPRAVGVAVVDVITALRVAQAARLGLPVTDTLVQVAVPGHGLYQVLRVPLGMLVEDLVAHLQLPEPPGKVITGGLLLGYAQYNMETPITQRVDGLVLQTGQDLVRYLNEPCFNCGYCVQSCPVNLLPNQLSKFCEYNRFEEAERDYLFHCIECGLCAYVCPARRPMLQLLRYGKQEICAMREVS